MFHRKKPIRSISVFEIFTVLVSVRIINKNFFLDSYRAIRDVTSGVIDQEIVLNSVKYGKWITFYFI